MHTDILASFLREKSELNTEEVQKICTLFQPLELKTGESFIETDSIVSKVGFIVDGVLKAVNNQADGKGAIQYFLSSGHFASEADGLYRKQVAKLEIQAAIPTKMLVITMQNLDYLLHNYTSVRLAFHKFSEQELVEILYARELSNKGTAKQRYLEFREKYPHINNKVKAKEIASYLAISPYTLSHIKRDCL